MEKTKTTKFKVKLLKETTRADKPTTEISSNYTGPITVSKEHKEIEVDALTACDAFIAAKNAAGDAGAWTPLSFQIIGPDNQNHGLNPGTAV